MVLTCGAIRKATHLVSDQLLVGDGQFLKEVDAGFRRVDLYQPQRSGQCELRAPTEDVGEVQCIEPG